MKKQNFAMLVLALAATSAFAQEEKKDGLMQDFDNLGGNEALLDAAQSAQGETAVEVVQDRVVDRRLRNELNLEFSGVLGGDSYLSTKNFGANYQFHITPRWSVGAKYNYAMNDLTSEGKNLIAEMGFIPEMDWAKHTVMGIVNFYPIYGKFNMLDLGVVQFDTYLLGGGGVIMQKTGSKATFTAGGGVAFWWSQHLTSRFEFRYQNMKADRYTGDKTLHLTVASISMGVLL